MTSIEHFRAIQEVLEDLPVVDSKLASREHGLIHKMLKVGVEKHKPINITMMLSLKGITMVPNHTIRPKRSSRRIIILIRVVKDTKPHGKIGPKLKRKLVISENRRLNKRTNNKNRVKEVAGSRPSERIRQTPVRDSTTLEQPRAANHNLIRVKILNMEGRDRG